MVVIAYIVAVVVLRVGYILMRPTLNVFRARLPAQDR